jgi:hypothetical protein
VVELVATIAPFQYVKLDEQYRAGGTYGTAERTGFVSGGTRSLRALRPVGLDARANPPSRVPARLGAGTAGPLRALRDRVPPAPSSRRARLAGVRSEAWRRRRLSEIRALSGRYVAAIWVIGATLLAIPAAAQQDLGFRYQDGKCVNADGEEGLNPGYVDECGGLRGHDLRQAPLDRVNLAGADLQAARLTRARMRRVILRDADLRGAELDGADLRQADLRSANLDRARLGGSDLTGAQLQDADLIRTDLVAAILRDADLTGANLRSADLRDADLSYADVTRANLRGARFNASTILPVTLSPALAQQRGMVFVP